MKDVTLRTMMLTVAVTWAAGIAGCDSGSAGPTGDGGTTTPDEDASSGGQCITDPDQGYDYVITVGMHGCGEDGARTLTIVRSEEAGTCGRTAFDSYRIRMELGEDEIPAALPATIELTNVERCFGPSSSYECFPGTGRVRLEELHIGLGATDWRIRGRYDLTFAGHERPREVGSFESEMQCLSSPPPLDCWAGVDDPPTSPDTCE